MRLLAQRLADRASRTGAATALVHGATAAQHAAHAASVLFGGDPTEASAEVLAVVAATAPAAPALAI